MKYRLINKHIKDITENEDFYEHRWIFKTNSALVLKRYVANQELTAENLSVMTVILGDSMSFHSYNSFKWVK